MSYIISDGKESFKELVKFISSVQPSSVYILTDENVNKYCLPVLLEQCEILKSAFTIEIPPGEEEKNITTAAKIISLLLENHADRKSLLINLGGGVVCDTGGFIASVYKRGIKFVNIPTTLLAMVDASIGGKNGIDFLDHKNIIGTFTNPGGVFIYPGFLKTLPSEEKRSGIAEIMKHLLLSDADRWKEIQENPNAFEEKSLEKLIHHSIQFKAEITREDFKEEGRRKILNFGHTIGHALEGISLRENHPLRHGEAIAAGMIAELFLSNKLTAFPESEMTNAVHYIRKMFEDISIHAKQEEVLPFLYSDKKNTFDRIAFSLLKAPGVPAGIVYPEIDAIAESLVFMNDAFSRALV